MKVSIKYIITLILILLVMYMPNIVKAYATENGLIYEIQDDGIHITGCDSSITGEITIPNEINGNKVVSIERIWFC